MMNRRSYNAVCGIVIGAALALLSLPALAQIAEGPSASDTDPPEISFSRSSYSACEGNSATLTVEKDGDGEAAVNYTTAAASPGPPATAGVDYVETSGFLHFEAEDTEKTITVQTKTDTDVTESSEVLKVELSLSSGGDGSQDSATLGSPWWAAVTILNVGTSC
ncbi:MAG: hypothetical protein OXP28_00770 [Gammaproteobacteria bacterium]|nr:hypothetical protein [Gammaproteobacteria bacterium]